MITSQPVLAYLRDRLRESLVPRELVGDVDLLTMLSEAYRDACERTRCLPTFTTLTLDGSDSYALPASWYETTGVYTSGFTIPEAPHNSAIIQTTGMPLWRTHTGREISFQPSPTTGTAIISYVETPPAFANISDPLDPRYPQEYAYLLVHHVRWKVQTLAGGAQHIAAAKYDHDLYDTGIAQMRRAVRNVNRSGPTRIALGKAPLNAG
jgi:hypothetical protein